MIQLQNIHKSFNETHVFRGLYLKIGATKTTVLIGPSGCGKSTLLRIVIGLITPESGTVLIDGKPLDEADIRAIRQKMGFVIQEGGLFPHFTAKQNVVLMAEYLDWDSNRVLERLAELTDLTQFPRDGLTRYPHELSGGQRQRVSLMRALMLDPQVLLLDEPLGALDPMIRADMQKDMVSIFRRLEKTVILVTHDMGEAAVFADEIVLMNDGRVIQQGSLKALIQNPADPFVTRFIHSQSEPWSRLEEMSS